MYARHAEVRQVIDVALTLHETGGGAALATTTVLNTKSRGAFGDIDRTLLICGELADDRDDMVVKAESWALRALAPWDPAAFVAFLERHDVRLAARVKREVGNKLRTGRKSG